MIIEEVTPMNGCVLRVVSTDGRSGTFDVSSYLDSLAFAPLKDQAAFALVSNGKYYVEWDCGADLSADTLEARMKWDADDDAKLMVAEDSEEYNAR